MQLDEQMKCWNHAAVKVLDIRRIVMEAGAQLSSYTLPANGFIYTIRGSAVLQLDGQTYKAERFYMLHGAKGSSLDIQTNEDFEYILLYYRAFLAFLVIVKVVIGTAGSCAVLFAIWICTEQSAGVVTLP